MKQIARVQAATLLKFEADRCGIVFETQRALNRHHRTCSKWHWKVYIWVYYCNWKYSQVLNYYIRRNIYITLLDPINCLQVFRPTFCVGSTFSFNVSFPWSYHQVYFSDERLIGFCFVEKRFFFIFSLMYHAV